MGKFYIKRGIVCILFLVLIASLFTLTGRGQPALAYAYSSGRPVLVTGSFGQRVSDAEDALAALTDAEGLGIDDAAKELRLLRADATAAGTLYRFAQYADGIGVFGREMCVSVDKRGQVLSVSGNYLSGVSVERPADTAGFHEKFPGVKAELSVYSLDREPTLCYTFVSNDGAARVFVDAESFERVASIPLKADATIPSEQVMLAQTDHLGGTVTLPVEKVIGEQRYILGDATRNIYMADAAESWDYSGTMYESTDGVFDDGAAVSAYDHLIASYDYYADGANIGLPGGWAGPDGRNDTVHDNAETAGETVVTALVHFGSKYNNAAYVTGVYDDPHSAVMIFGDGDGAGYGNFAGQGLDVAAHEYTHIVTDNTAGLLYLNGSGAINEAVSDVFGALVEGKPMTDDGFWLCGEDLTLQEKAFRDVKDPNSLEGPTAIGERYWHPFCYEQHDHRFCDNGGVHTNSTIISHLAYAMYAAMPSYFTPQATGILWFDTLLRCFPDTGFEDFRILMEQSALELGFPDEARAVVAAAFDAAGISASTGTHKVQFTKHGVYTEVIYELTGEYGETFVMPDLDSAPDGYETLYWYLIGAPSDNGQKFYKGETYKIPAYDLVLRPYNVPKVWNDRPLSVFKGTGQREDPYLIETAADLASLAYYTNTLHAEYARMNVRYKLTADIDLQNIPWIPIGLNEKLESYAYLDGGGHVIRNLSIGADFGEAYCGLFGVACSTISNLGIESGRTEVAATHLGAFVGMLKGKIVNCYNGSDVINTHTSAQAYTGGLAGLVWHGEIGASYNTGTVSGMIAGGIFGAYISTGARVEGLGVVPSVMSYGNLYNTGPVTGTVAGGIAGSSANTYLVNCINTGAVAARTDVEGEKFIGGITGKLNFPDRAIYYDKYDADENAGILGCRNTGTIAGNGAHAGGIAGLLYDPATTGNTVTEKNVFKAQDGLKAFGHPADVFSDPKFMGEAAAESTDALFEGDFDFDSAAYFRDFDRWSVLGEVSIFDGNAEWRFEPGKMPTLKTPEYWIDYAADSFAGGDGSQDSPYEIATPEQLARLAYLVGDRRDRAATSYQSAFYVLTADIDLSGKLWTGIGAEEIRQEDFGTVSGYFKGFDGVFDGRGHAIKNCSARTYVRPGVVTGSSLSVSRYSYPALFTVLDSGSSQHCIIRDVRLENANNLGRPAGGIVAIKKNLPATISDCVVTGVLASDEFSGGIVALQEAGFDRRLTIENCKNAAVVSGRYAGGIVGGSLVASETSSGVHRLDLAHCVNTGDVVVFDDWGYYAEPACGGMVGWTAVDTSLQHCTNTGSMRNFDDEADLGGLIGLVTRNDERTERIAITIDRAKQSGTYAGLGRVNRYGAAVGLLEAGAGERIDLTVEESLFADAVVFDAGVNAAGAGDTRSIQTDNRTNAGAADFAYDSIDYFFDPAFWGDSIDPEAANDVYEFFGNERIEFTVTFLDELGRQVGQDAVRYRCLPTVPVPPAKSPTVETEYVFDGWEGLPDGVTADVEVTARYRAVPRTYTVVFKNYDGTVVSSQQAAYGTTPAAPQTVPQKPSDETYEYTFEGWGELRSVEGDAEYTALFKAVPKPAESSPPHSPSPHTWYIWVAMGVVAALAVGAVAVVAVVRRRRR